jgi:ABC-type multidrug transport system ATPase subunit
VALLDEGRVVADGSPDELRRQALTGEALDVQSERFERGDIAALWQLPVVEKVEWVSNDVLRCYVEDIGSATVAIGDALHERGTEVISIRPYLPTFDEVFLKLVERA